jgi:predicted  nucleic acid-binding Zn-ribbon protein
MAQKKQPDLSSIDLMLKNSFSAIKLDMLQLKEAQDIQLNDVGGLKQDLNDFKNSCFSKEEYKRLREHISTIESNQRTISGKFKDLEKYAEEIVDAVNKRIKALNKEFDKIVDIKQKLNSKLKEVDILSTEIKILKKNTIDKKKMKLILDDVNDQFDRIEKSTKKDFAKLSKKIK